MSTCVMRVLYFYLPSCGLFFFSDDSAIAEIMTAKIIIASTLIIPICFSS